MENNNFTSVETIRAKNAAILPGLINRRVFRNDDKRKAVNRGKVETRQYVVLLPIEFGIEEYKERDVKIASFCRYDDLQELESGEYEIGFDCLSLCIVKDLRLDHSTYYADVEVLPEQPINMLDFEIRTLLDTIQRQFKEYLKLDPDVDLDAIEKVKNPESIDDLICGVVWGALLDLAAKRMLLNERDPNEKGQDYGKCVAVLDNSGEQAVLTVLTDRGDEQIAIGSSEPRADISEQLDTAIQYYANGASKEDILEHTGLDPSALTEHIKGLPTEEADYLKETRRRSLGEDEIVGAQVPAETKNQENWRDSVDPKVLALATNPDSITDPVAKREALDKAGRISGGERIILQDNEGNPRWGEELSEPGQVFAFNGNIRGNYDSAPEDPEELRAQRLDIHLASGALRGNVTHVIVETEDGQQLMIRRTNETNSANDQLFDVASTGRAGTDGERRSLDSSTLKDVVAVVGEPLVLGIDPQTGKHIKTRSPITKITTLDMRKDPVDPSHPRLSKPELRRDTVGEFGEAMRAARNHSADKVAVDEVESVMTESPSDKVESTNPYESLAPEQLAKVRDNIADSIVQGIRKYDLAEVTRASANLAAIQREIEARSPETRPAHQRGEVDGAVTYITEPDKAVIQRIVGELQKIDGASNIARAMYGGLETPQQDESDPEAILQAAEMSSLLANISREIRSTTGSDLAESTNNPYASMKNEELATTVNRLKQTIQERTGQGLDTTDFRNRLALVGQVIRSRQ